MTQIKTIKTFTTTTTTLVFNSRRKERFDMSACVKKKTNQNRSIDLFERRLPRECSCLENIQAM